MQLEKERTIINTTFGTGDLFNLREWLAKITAFLVVSHKNAITKLHKFSECISIATTAEAVDLEGSVGTVPSSTGAPGGCTKEEIGRELSELE